MISVDQNAENSIVVAPGSNGTLNPADFDKAISELEESDFVLIQLEIPIPTVEYIAGIAGQKQKRVILRGLEDIKYGRSHLDIPAETE